TIDGVVTDRISGRLDVRRLLADVAALLDSGPKGAGLLTPKLQAQIATAVKSSKVQIWSGADDHVLRQLTGVVDFTFKDGTSPITGLDGGRIDLRLRLDDVNATSFEVTAPKRARPLSELGEDDGIGDLLSGLGATFRGKASGARDGGEAFLRCIKAAGSDAAEVARCSSKLAP
nr:hypothetical protein [Solirubrobacterales bacterium]